MTNPYEAPLVSPSTPLDPTAFSDDPRWRRRRLGERICGIVAALPFVLIGGFALIASLIDPGSNRVETLIGSGIGLTLLVVGGAALLGWSWTLYVIATLALAGVAFLVYDLLTFVIWVESAPRLKAVLIIRVIVAAPTLACLAVATLGIGFHLTKGRRQSQLARAARTV